MSLGLINLCGCGNLVEHACACAHIHRLQILESFLREIFLFHLFAEVFSLESFSLYGNILHIWTLKTIPTYRAYQLYDDIIIVHVRL